MPRKLLIVIALSFLGAIQARSKGCKNEQCECYDDDVVICEGIDSIPQNLPEDTEELRIQNSPELTKIGKTDLDEYEDLTTLSFLNTGIAELDKKALSNLEDLRTFEIISASNIRGFKNGLFDENGKLNVIIVRDCPLFSSLQDGIFGSSLQKLELTNNSIESFSEGVLRDSPHLDTIDLSNNTPLKSLPRYAFSHLTGLTKLLLQNCQLEVLYPEHVQASYESGSLSIFDGRDNNWHCDDMCEFIAWKDNVEKSNDVYSRMGFCSYPKDLRSSRVLSLEPSDLCYNATPSDAFIITLGVLFGSVILVTCCFLLAARYCLGGLFSRTPTPAASDTSAVGERRRTAHTLQTNSDFADVEGQRGSSDVVNGAFQADCEVGSWNIGDIEPPSYDAVYKIKPNSEVRVGIGEDDIETGEDMAPPPYEEPSA